ncbi:alpha/beta hydrolase [Tunicatimonas pelagia]|uniref:alpha/beta hydrolase n=1 Tax=Tunicatimonas pelagia TaxID=931531 RepID=UPI002666B6C7|nr:alpha/beta hydrolase-fold protein [Tunicatimonas pelagia]WKN42666.1 alpha/beta hydrolase-fold protein [Tunicatimonas pelagia]
MKKSLIILFTLFTSCTYSVSDQSTLEEENKRLKSELDSLKKQCTEIEHLADSSLVTLPNTTVRELISKYNGQTYKIKIQFPRGYEKGEEVHPVLYVIDAETNFGGISYIVQRLIKDKLIPKILLVGIAYGTDYDNFYRLRSRDLTPVEDKELVMRRGSPPDPTGGADNFSNFIEFELFPFIAAHYRVKEEDRAIYGHSYGGLYGTYTFLQKPQLFNRYILLSPSLWYKDNLLLNEMKNSSLPSAKSKLYMASGELEGRIDDLQLAFIHELEKKNVDALTIKSEVMEDETHRTIFGPGLTNGLRFIYSD